MLPALFLSLQRESDYTCDLKGLDRTPCSAEGRAVCDALELACLGIQGQREPTEGESNLPPKARGGVDVSCAGRFRWGTRSNQKEGADTGPEPMPRASVLAFSHKNRSH